MCRGGGTPHLNSSVPNGVKKTKGAFFYWLITKFGAVVIWGKNIKRQKEKGGKCTRKRKKGERNRKKGEEKGRKRKEKGRKG
jgi:hypothetical protein